MLKSTITIQNEDRFELSKCPSTVSPDTTKLRSKLVELFFGKQIKTKNIRKKEDIYRTLSRTKELTGQLKTTTCAIFILDTKKYRLTNANNTL